MRSYDGLGVDGGGFYAPEMQATNASSLFIYGTSDKAITLYGASPYKTRVYQCPV